MNHREAYCWWLLNRTRRLPLQERQQSRDRFDYLYQTYVSPAWTLGFCLVHPWRFVLVQYHLARWRSIGNHGTGGDL